MRRKLNDSNLVYTTGPKAISDQLPQFAKLRKSRDGIARVSRETKGRRGKIVTVIEGLELPETKLRELASELKRRCGGGGSVKKGRIEIQGDHRESLVVELEAQGFRAKQTGG